MRYKIAECVTEYEPHYEMLRRKDGAISNCGRRRARYQIDIKRNNFAKKSKRSSHISRKHNVSIFFAGSEFYKKIYFGRWHYGARLSG